MKRYLYDIIVKDLKEKMVFIGGPRQVGKTYLAQSIEAFKNKTYLTWDNRSDKKSILSALWPAEKALVILDELHKYNKWKTFLKGEYDKNKEHIHFLVTGSARLDVYRKGGDSLQGRYHYHRLHPFTLSEAIGTSLKIKKTNPLDELQFKQSNSKEEIQALFKFGGFPEPFISQSNQKLRRWQNERMERFFREDVRDLEKIPDLSSIEILSQILPDRVGSPLSINSLREDVDASHKGIKNWMEILERLYFLYRLSPYSKKTIRALKKEQKMYLWDWSVIENQASRYENMIASHLLKFCHYMKDWEGYNVDLHYVRDVDKRELDFLVTYNNKPWFAVEAKLSNTTPSKHLKYFAERLSIPFLYQVVLNSNTDVKKDNIRIIPANKFLTALI